MNMKTRTKNCGVFAALTAVLFITAALVTSCVDPIGPGGLTVPQVEEQTPFTPPEGKGYLRLNISIPKGARTIMPDTDAIQDLSAFDDFDIYVLDGDDVDVTDGDYVGVELDDGEFEPIALLPGNYTVRVLGNLDGVAVAVGEDEVEITASAGATAEIVLKEIVDGKEDGTFAWDLTPATTYPATSAIMSIIPLSGGTSTHQPYENDLIGEPELSGSVLLKSGYYRVEIEQSADGYKTVKTISALHIYQGFISTFTYTLPALKPDAYTVVFDLNGSTGTPPTPQSVDHGDKVTKPSPDPEHSSGLNAFRFAGWFLADGTTEFTFAGGNPNLSTAIVIAPLALYAKWTPVYAVTFDYNDGRGGSTTYETAHVVSGEKVTAPTTNPTHTSGTDAFSFAGWYEEPAGTTAFNFDTAIVAVKTLYAKWTPKYAVTFDYNDGRGGSTTYETVYVVSGEKVTAPTTDPEHTGGVNAHHFVGWYEDQAGTTAFNFDTAIVAVKTLYAKWTPKYAVTFDYNDGDPDSTGTTFDTKYVVSGEKVTAPTPDPEDRTDSDLDFLGWYEEPAGTTEFDFDTAIVADITLYAKWGAKSEAKQNLVVSITDVTFTGPVDLTGLLSATADVNQIDDGTITVTLTPPVGITSYRWYVDGFEDTTCEDDDLVFDTSVVANKIVGAYKITVWVTVGGLEYSEEIEIGVTHKP